MSESSMSMRTVGGGKSGKKKYRHIRYDATPQQMEELREAFDHFVVADDDDDNRRRGLMRIADIKIMLRSLGYEPKKEEIKKILTEINPEKSDFICFEEFVHIMSFKMKEKDTDEETMRAFKLFDEDNTGRITFSNLKKVAKDLGQDMTDEELREMIDEADFDGDGEISPQEFSAVMRKAHLL